MEQVPQKKFSSTEDEIAFLRNQVAEKERALLERNKEVDSVDIETLGRETLSDYAEHESSVVLDRNHEITEEDTHSSVESIGTSEQKVEEILALSEEKGIRNALTVLEKLDDAFLTDEVHRKLVAKLHGELKVADLQEGMPLFRVLNMTLFEVALPEHIDDNNDNQLSLLFSAMEQFYAGMQTIGGSTPSRFTLEIAVSDKRDDIIFYVSVPTEFVNLFEKQILSLFPNAVLLEQQND